ncbi:hypothetical protein [Shewanella sp.]|uniref:hypothetical protein n=1 Tax=Shewanella sp. TaxID=50422 RepID=UPI003A97BBC9
MIWSIFSSAKRYPAVAVGKEDGFVDLAFTISTAKKYQSGAFEIEVKGKLEGANVGFAIELLPSWEANPIEGVANFYWGEAFFKSTGRESEAFISALADLYGATISHIVIPNKVYAKVVGLDCNPEQLETTPCRMKFFFNSDGAEELYSEVFINVDLAANMLQFNEKDVGYRAPLLRSLMR